MEHACPLQAPSTACAVRGRERKYSAEGVRSLRLAVPAPPRSVRALELRPGIWPPLFEWRWPSLRVLRVMRRRICCVLALLLLDCAASERMSESYEDDLDAEYDAEYEDDDNEMPFAPALNKLAAKVQRAVDSQGVLRARRYGNIANGVLLGATGSVTLIASVFGLQLSRVVLSIYMTAAGALLAGVELGVAPVAGWTKENLNWLTSHSGKTALLFFAGGLSWCAAWPERGRRAGERETRVGI